MSVTLRSLERRTQSSVVGASARPSAGTSALEQWYARVADLPIDQLAIDDLGRAVRQSLSLEHIVPLALAHVKADPSSGALFDGELAQAVARIPRAFWEANPSVLLAARPVLADALNSADDDVAQELRRFAKIAAELLRSNTAKRGTE
jgi:hypothetical protein